MKDDKFKIVDKSGDRKYFTIIPNYIVNHSTIYEQAIYLYMKRVVGVEPKVIVVVFNIEHVEVAVRINNV